MRQFMIFLAFFIFGLNNIVCAQELTEEKIVERNTIQILAPRERDPFGLSRKLLKKNVQDKVVSFLGEGLDRFDLPRIEITGVMVVGNKTMATAKIETLGEVTLKPNEKIVVKSKKSRKNVFTSFLIKEITPEKLVIVLEGGQEIHGRFR